MPNTPLIRVIASPDADGIRYQIRWGDIVLTFPLSEWRIPARDLVRQPEWPRLTELESLLDAGMLTQDDGGYRLAWSSCDSLEPEQLERLGLPPETHPTISIRAVGNPVTPRYKIHVTLTGADWSGNLLDWGHRTGRLLTTGRGTVYRFGATLTRLLDLAEQDMGPPGPARVMRTAEIQVLARQLGARLHGFLAHEAYALVQEVGAAPVMTEAGDVTIEPTYDDDQVPPALRDALAASGDPYIDQARGRERIRVAVRPDALEKRRRIADRRRRLSAREIARLVENPEAFVPEDWGIDLARFSERVKGLNIRVYRAQPFIQALPVGTGWFEVQAGVRLDDVLGPDDATAPSGDGASILTADRLAELTEIAGFDGVVRQGDTLIVLPDNPRQVLTALKTLEQTAPSTEEAGRLAIPRSRLPFVLDIFDNIEDLEFNQPLAELRMVERTAASAVPPDGLFHGALKPHQLAGFRRLIQQRLNGIGLLVADEMGLGKTVMAIAALAYWHAHGELRPSLLVMPTSLLDAWEEHLRRHGPPLTLYRHHGPQRARYLDEIPDADLVLSTYETVNRDQLLLGEVSWQVVLADEAQNIKNASTGRTSALKAMKNRYRVALTGTPVENSVVDLWSIVDFVQPGYLGSRQEFEREYQHAWDTLNHDDWAEYEDKITQRLAPVLIHRTKDDVHLDLPPKEIKEYRVPMGRQQMSEYTRLIKQVHDDLTDPLAAIQRFRGVAAHPLAWRHQPDWGSIPPGDVPKLAQTLEILDAVKARREKALLFTDLRSIQDMLRYWVMERFGITPNIINGDTQYRQDIVNRFNTGPDFAVLILSPKAAGVGLTITGANHVIHYTRWWNPAVENQATDRVHRIGQTRPVTVYLPIAVDPGHRILVRGTVDELIADLLQRKSELARHSIVPARDETDENGWRTVLETVLQA